MFKVQQSFIDDNVPHIRFACNLSVCKGACCTLAGGQGAPLLDEEIEQIKNAFPIIKSSLPQEHLDTIAQHGLYEGEPGHYTTRCFNNHACVFVMYENGIAKCAFEKACGEGKIKWKKPISCNLFPIRVDRGVSVRLRYERIAECDSALDCGENQKVFLSNFLTEPLIRAFGLSWYNDFQLMCSWERNNTDSV